LCARARHAAAAIGSMGALLSAQLVRYWHYDFDATPGSEGLTEGEGTGALLPGGDVGRGHTIVHCKRCGVAYRS
jgi:hypothetical protein